VETRLPVWMLALRGVLAIIFGVLAVAWPDVTVLALALLFGVYALVDGVGLLIGAFRDSVEAGRRVLYAVAGVFGVVAGVLAFLWPGATALVLAIVVGAWALVTGVLDIWVAVRTRANWLLAVIGAASVIAGVLILVRPDIGAIAIAQVIGVYAIVAGALMLAAAWTAHRERGAVAGDARHA